jgi:hypothetical protein
LAVQPQDGNFRYKTTKKKTKTKTRKNRKTEETWQTKIFIAQVQPQCFVRRGNHRPCEHWQQQRWQQ